MVGQPCGVPTSGRYPPAGHSAGSEVPNSHAYPSGHVWGAWAPDGQNACAAGHAVGSGGPTGQYVPDGQVISLPELGAGKAGKPGVGAVCRGGDETNN